MRKLIVVMILLLFPLGALAYNGEITKRQIRILQDWAVKIQSTEGNRGGGIIVGKNEIITCYHIVRNMDNETDVIISLNGKRIIGKITKKDKGLDLALIEVEEEFNFYVPLETLFRVGERVYVVAAPMDFEDTFLIGRIANTVKWEGQELMVIDIKILSGCSGGGVFNWEGKLIGLISGSWGFSTHGDFLGAAIPAATIKKFLEEENDRRN